MGKKRPMSARKPGKLERRKVVGAHVNATDARCYIELTRVNETTERINLGKNYQVIIDGNLVSRHYGQGE